MKYYDVTYKKPIVHEEGYPSLGTLVAMQVEDSASMDEIIDRAKYLATFGAPWDKNGLEIVSVVETPEENRPRPYPLED